MSQAEPVIGEAGTARRTLKKGIAPAIGLFFVAPLVAEFLLPSLAGWIPPAWMIGALTLVFGSAALFVPKDWGWGAVAALLALDFAMLVMVMAWSCREGWGIQHKLALAAGAALAYGWHAFLQHPAVG